MTTALPNTTDLNTSPAMDVPASAFPSAGALAAALTGFGISFHRRGEDLALKGHQLDPSLVEAVRRYKQPLLALADAQRPLPAPPLAPAVQAAPIDDNSPSGFHRGASDVLRRVAASETPQSHTALMQHLAEAGYTRKAAREAIAETQGRGWIEHDLKLGYVLSSFDLSGDTQQKT